MRRALRVRLRPVFRIDILAEVRDLTVGAGFLRRWSSSVYGFALTFLQAGTFLTGPYGDGLWLQKRLGRGVCVAEFSLTRERQVFAQLGDASHINATHELHNALNTLRIRVAEVLGLGRSFIGSLGELDHLTVVPGLVAACPLADNDGLGENWLCFQFQARAASTIDITDGH